jgi:predicted amidohydrolase
VVEGFFVFGVFMSSTDPNGERVFPDTVVAAVQMDCRIGRKADNVARSLALIEEAAAQGAVIVVLPELSNTGYVFNSRPEAFALAEAVPDGPTTQAWIAAAARLNIHIVAGITERAGDRLYNAAAVVGPRGYLGTYRKLHLWGEENLFFEPGDLGLPVFDTEHGRLGVAICYDGWFPEVYRLLAMQGVDIVCMPTNWVPMPGQDPRHPTMANTLAMAAAHSNGLNIVCADRVGVERGQPFLGRSLVVGAQGWPLAGPASPDQEQVLYASINLKQSRSARHLNPYNVVLRDRRDDLYRLVPGPGQAQAG